MDRDNAKLRYANVPHCPAACGITVEFADLLKQLGFAERIRGDHHIFTKEGVEEILNLQPKGALAKPYQVRQVRKIIVQYKLGEEDDGEI